MSDVCAREVSEDADTFEVRSVRAADIHHPADRNGWLLHSQFVRLHLPVVARFPTCGQGSNQSSEDDFDFYILISMVLHDETVHFCILQQWCVCDLEFATILVRGRAVARLQAGRSVLRLVRKRCVELAEEPHVFVASAFRRAIAARIAPRASQCAI